MKTLLLDVNVLIALIDPAHQDHDTADEWFASFENPSWATCPITENAVLRILGASSYRNSPGPPSEVAKLLNVACTLHRHVFWPEVISLLTDSIIDMSHLRHSAQITDIYLLALAVRHGGRLATFDHRIEGDAVQGGKDSLLLIPR